MSTASSVTRIDGSHPTRLNKEADIGKPPPLLRGVYGPYVLLPLIAALVWLGGLAALMGIWAAAGTPRYEEDSAGIAYISNVGAYHQTLFICICAVTAFFYIASLLTERWLRHVDRIPAHGVRNRRVVIYDLCAIIFCCIGSAALVVLSAFNCYSYPTVHWVGTGVFVLCVAISAVFQTLEILALKKDHPDRSHLLRNAVLKLIIVTLAICMAITFGVLYGLGKKNDINSPNPAEAAKGNRLTSAAAVLEWSIALVLDAYFFTLVLDLWPASKSSPRYLRRMARWEGQALEKLGLEPGVLPSVVPPTGAERNGRFEGLEQDAQTGGPAMTSAYVHPVTGYPSATNGGFPADTNGAFLPDPATTMTPASYPAVSERQPSAVFSPAGGPVSHFPTAAHPAGSDAPPVTAAAASSPAYQPQGADVELAPPLETMYSQTTGSVARY